RQAKLRLVPSPSVHFLLFSFCDLSVESVTLILTFSRWEKELLHILRLAASPRHALRRALVPLPLGEDAGEGVTSFSITTKCNPHLAVPLCKGEESRFV